MRLIQAFIILVILGFLTAVFACECGSTSVCDSYALADAVVVAELIDFKPTNVSKDRIFVGGKSSEYEIGQEVTLRVHHWYKGGKGETIKLTQPNSSCDWNFESKERNKEYLFYLSFSDKYKDYSVISCGRSSEVAKAEDDMQWLKALPGSLKRTRISGIALTNDTDFPPVSDIPIVISDGKRKFNLKTDRFGLYEKWDIPPGEYRVTASPPKTFELSWTTSVPNNWLYFWSSRDQDPKALDITIEAGKCGGIDFMFKKK